MAQSCGCNPEVMRPNCLATPRQPRPDVCMHARHCLGNGDRRQLREHVLNERVPPSPARADSPMDAVEQFADRDDADRSLFVSEQRLELLTGTFPLDEHARVNQDGQGSSGTPISARMRSTSRANSSSTSGAEVSSSRNLAADIVRDRGGPITATVALLRVTENSSPAATRFRSSEKRLAASVALILVTHQGYQINLIWPRPTARNLRAPPARLRGTSRADHPLRPCLRRTSPRRPWPGDCPSGHGRAGQVCKGRA
jgi:hypothetical protein